MLFRLYESKTLISIPLTDSVSDQCADQKKNVCAVRPLAGDRPARRGIGVPTSRAFEQLFAFFGSWYTRARRGLGVGVIDVLVAGEAREDRLPKTPGETLLTVPAGAWLGEEVRRRLCQAQGVAEFAAKQPATVGTDRGTRKGEIDGAVELEAQMAGFLFT